MLRAAVLTLLIAAPLAPVAATPALAQSEAAWVRERNAAAMEREAARQRASAWEREVRARQQRTRTDEILRGLAPGELAGGPGVISPYRPSAITPLPPPARDLPAPRPTPAGAEQARLDALMGDAMAKSQARVRALTGQRSR